MDRHRALAFALTAPAGLAGSPCVVVPAVRVAGEGPLGLALVGGRGSDVALCDLASRGTRGQAHDPGGYSSGFGIATQELLG
jgi:Asp-tRNA(Asn)/Glu-tRNA(Gln) amidotransferase A subunit family amidase